MTLSRKKKQFAELYFDNPSREHVCESMNITAERFDYFFNDIDVLDHIQILYDARTNAASNAAYAAVRRSISDLATITTDSATSAKNRIEAAKALMTMYTQLKELEATGRLISELDQITQ